MPNILHDTKKIRIISFISVYNIDLIFQSRWFDLISWGFLRGKKKTKTKQQQQPKEKKKKKTVFPKAKELPF